MKRLFIAIDLSDNQEVNMIYQEVKKRLLNNKIGWVKPENMHLTLKYLGSTPEEKVKKIIEDMHKSCENRKEISLEFSRIGIFGSSYKPRVIWLGFKENVFLEEFAEEIKKAMLPLGFSIDRQNFVPHLTLGRINKIESKRYFQSVLDQYRSLEFKPVTINKIYLYESILHKEGAEYKVIGKFLLRG